MTIDKRSFPWIILAVFVFGMFIAYQLGLKPEHIGRNHNNQGGPRHHLVGPAIAQQSDLNK